MADLWNQNKRPSFIYQMMMEATMVREWVEAAGFMLVIAACYMMVVPV